MVAGLYFISLWHGILIRIVCLTFIFTTRSVLLSPLALCLVIQEYILLLTLLCLSSIILIALPLLCMFASHCLWCCCLLVWCNFGFELHFPKWYCAFLLKSLFSSSVSNLISLCLIGSGLDKAKKKAFMFVFMLFFLVKQSMHFLQSAAKIHGKYIQRFWNALKVL